MRLLRVCKTRVLKLPYRDRCSLNTTGLQCVRFSEQQSSTYLHTVACNLGKLNAGAKIRASHYRARFALSVGTADYLATCSYPLKCCSVPYATVHIYNSLLHAYNTRIHVHERAGLGRISARQYACVHAYTVTCNKRMRLLCRI